MEQKRELRNRSMYLEDKWQISIESAEGNWKLGKKSKIKIFYVISLAKTTWKGKYKTKTYTA